VSRQQKPTQKMLRNRIACASCLMMEMVGVGWGTLTLKVKESSGLDALNPERQCSHINPFYTIYTSELWTCKDQWGFDPLQSKKAAHFSNQNYVCKKKYCLLVNRHLIKYNARGAHIVYTSIGVSKCKILNTLPFSRHFKLSGVNAQILQAMN